jgi:polyhydroxyalkanoate synthesis repressor PhaR
MDSEIREVQAPGGPPKVIKRYANRKLYDTGESRYVTLEEIGTMVKQGIEIQIVDNRSKGDLTAVTLAQIILEEEKKRNRMPLDVLRDIIRNGGESISGFIQREVQPRVTSLREEAEAGLKLLRRDVPGDKPRELLAALQTMLMEWQGRVDERLHAAVETMSSFPQIARELQQIASRLGELEQRIEHLEEEGFAGTEVGATTAGDTKAGAPEADVTEAGDAGAPH